MNLYTKFSGDDLHNIASISNVTNDASTRSTILTLLLKTFFLQLFVSYTLLHAIYILKFVKTGLDVYNDKN